MAEAKDDIAGGEKRQASDINQNAKNANDAGGFRDDKLAGETIAGETLPVPIYQNTTDNEFYACDANDTAKLNFVGFAISNSTNGNAIDLQMSGIVRGFSGLDEGEKYYVQDAVGTIGKTQGTTRILAGIAISATELLIMKSSKQTYITESPTHITIAGGTNAKLTTITCGFRPKRIYGYAGETTHSASAEFECDGNANQQYHGPGTGGGHSADVIGSGNILHFYEFNGSMYFRIQNITATGFDIQIYNGGNVGSGAVNGVLRLWIDGE